MKTACTKQNSRRVCNLVFRHLLAACLVAAAGTSANSQDCTLALQLKDPVIRADYETVIAVAQTTNLSVEEMYANVQNVTFTDIPVTMTQSGNRLLDPISMECITCHDGTTAISVNYKIKSPETIASHSLDNIGGSHPVGTDYTRYIGRKDYAPYDSLPNNMVLMEGKLSCITCHDMLSTNRAYLAVDLEQSNLCFTCHRK
jgi:predicted CXXCH cytochrome family protein